MKLMCHGVIILPFIQLIAHPARTPEYLAPEILNRTGHGRAADWWSLGALVYEMLTGMPPFYSRDRDRLFQKILTSELQFPRNVSHEAKVRSAFCSFFPGAL